MLELKKAPIDTKTAIKSSIDIIIINIKAANINTVKRVITQH